jgi:hypothetical protein
LISGLCSRYGEKENTKIWWEVMGKKDYLEDLGVDKRIIIQEIISSIWCERA